MSLVKRIGRSDAVRRALCGGIALYIRAIWASNRWTVEGAAHADRLHAANKPYIGAFWHGRLLMMPFGWPRVMPLAMLISAHPDGRIIADAVRRLGVDIIAGSTNHGASEALRAMVRALRKGNCIAITPDGPDGPAMTASAGIVQVARITGAPIVPITYATSRRVILKSWDRFHLPLPFGRGIFLIGEPIVVPPDTDEAQGEALRAQLETRLRAITAEADRRMGHGVVAPGTLSRDAFRARRRLAARPN
ncbi:MAG TPA: lysophospholipid acyltransferase family protein [Stellaceae bacterium]|jgi:hypothetical protein|nr:lysophospholipid acyltransferase family protein [Stellaceae bacterium]